MAPPRGRADARAEARTRRTRHRIGEFASPSIRHPISAGLGRGSSDGLDMRMVQAAGRSRHSTTPPRWERLVLSLNPSAEMRDR